MKINGENYKASSVPEIKQKEIRYCKAFKCYYIPSEIIYKDIEMKGYWIKMKGQNSWKLLISTDKKLTFIKAMKYYQVRWSIEVFF